ncbi:MAG: endonuclease domain-containing protein [Clostridia bacterium]|nr:endonuclease domain-containing protein [Clostridia bacterium]
MSLNYNGKNIEYAKTMRKQATPQERKLWYDFLRDYPVRFQRQKCIGNYIADFYCSEAGLVVEVDGSQHFDEANEKYDRKRTEYLAKLGIMVIRVTNADINTNFRGVCELIDVTVKNTVV